MHHKPGGPPGFACAPSRLSIVCLYIIGFLYINSTSNSNDSLKRLFGEMAKILGLCNFINSTIFIYIFFPSESINFSFASINTLNPTLS